MPKSRGRKPKSADKGKPLDHYRKLIKVALKQEGLDIRSYSHAGITQAAKVLKAHTERA